jgi:hypothetical protein
MVNRSETLESETVAPEQMARQSIRDVLAGGAGRAGGAVGRGWGGRVPALRYILAQRPVSTSPRRVASQLFNRFPFKDCFSTNSAVLKRQPARDSSIR